MTRRTGGHRGPFRWGFNHAGVIWAFGFGVLAYLTRSRHPTFDAWNYSLGIESAIRLHPGGIDPKLWHPHHLAYQPLGYLLTIASRSVFGQIPALLVLQLLSAVSAAITFYAIAQLIDLSRIGRDAAPRFMPFYATLLIGLTFAFWYYSGEAEVYLPALMFALLAVTVLARSRTLDPGRIAIVTILLVAAVTMHQMMALLAVPLGVWLLVGRGNRARGLPWLLGLWALGSLLVYFFVWKQSARFSEAGRPGFAYWVTYYAHVDMRSQLGWGHPGTRTLFQAVIGLGRSFSGGHFIFALSPSVLGRLRRMLPGSTILQEAALVSGVSRAQAMLAMVATIGGAVFWIRALVSACRRPTARGSRGGPERIDLLFGLWAITYAVFTLWWEADNLEFWLLALPGLLGWILIRSVNLSPVRLGIWIALVGAASYLGSIGPKVTGPSRHELAMFARVAGVPDSPEGGRIWVGFAEPFLPSQPLPPLWRSMSLEKGDFALRSDLAQGLPRVWILPDSLSDLVRTSGAKRIETTGAWSTWRLPR